jgi:uncharacterized membrane protein HdeD (DUF308 family)
MTILLIYILILGILQSIIGIIELIFPVKSFNIWKLWIQNKYFSFHGILQILVGFPLTIYNNSLSGILFLIGIIYVVSGPFIIIYPEKIKLIFSSYLEETAQDGGKKIIILDSVIKIIIGCLCIASYLLSIYN